MNLISIEVNVSEHLSYCLDGIKRAINKTNFNNHFALMDTTWMAKITDIQLNYFSPAYMYDDLTITTWFKFERNCSITTIKRGEYILSTIKMTFQPNMEFKLRIIPPQYKVLFQDKLSLSFEMPSYTFFQNRFGKADYGKAMYISAESEESASLLGVWDAIKLYQETKGKATWFITSHQNIISPIFYSLDPDATVIVKTTFDSCGESSIVLRNCVTDQQTGHITNEAKYMLTYIYQGKLSPLPDFYVKRMQRLVTKRHESKRVRKIVFIMDTLYEVLISTTLLIFIDIKAMLPSIDIYR